MPRPFITVTLFIASLLACNESFGPDSSCNERDGIRICTNRSEYAPGSGIEVTISNRSSGTVYEDVCALGLVGVSSREHEFDATYNPARHCGADVTLEKIVAAMREILPDGVLTETVDIPGFTFQGFFRVNVWLLDAEGQLLSQTPYTTPVFDIFRSAGS